jgi:hypothetical protein
MVATNLIAIQMDLKNVSGANSVRGHVLLMRSMLRVEITLREIRCHRVNAMALSIQLIIFVASSADSALKHVQLAHLQ